MNVIPEDLFYRQESKKREGKIFLNQRSEPVCETAITSKLFVPFFLSTEYTAFTVSVNQKA